MSFPWWIPVALASYALGAVVQLTDRFLLTRAIKDYLSYAFFVGLWSGASIVVAPVFLNWHGLTVTAISLVAGMIFVPALLFFFRALQKYDASSVIPATGASVAVFTFIFAFFAIGEVYPPVIFMAFLLLVAGHVFITARDPGEGFVKSLFNRDILAASVLFAAAAVLRKMVYGTEDLGAEFFISISIWFGVGSSLAALSMLFLPAWRRRILKTREKTPRKNFLLFLTNQIAGGGFGVLLNLAIALGPVALVQALQGVQYAFVLAGAAIVSAWFPKILHEETSGGLLARKLAAILLIGSGLAIIAFLSTHP